MDRLFPSAPTPPNPVLTAGLQTASNVSTGVASSILSNVNQTTPSGSLDYQITHTYPWTDPATNTTYNIPVWRAYQSPPAAGTNERHIYDANQAAQSNLADTAKNQTFYLRDYLNPNNPDGTPKPSIMSGAPALGDPNLIDQGASPQFGYGGGGPIQTSLGNAGDITRSYGPGDFSADRQRVEEALYGRINPQLERDRSNLEQRLADQGIRYGSPAYDDAMRQLNQQQTDARLAVTQQGGAEQQRMMDMAAKRAGFENAAQQQAFMQSLQGGQFYNQAQQQGYNQEQQRAQFYNQAAQQDLSRRQAMINADNTARQQYLNEAYASRNQPINEITAIMSGSQLQQPQWAQTTPTSVANTDIAGLINANFTQQMGNFTAQSQQMQNLMGGIFGMIGGIASDERIKNVGDKVGTIFAAGPDGKKPLPIYEFSYKDDPTSTRHIGPMAQDVEKIDRSAVKTHGGVKYIDKTKMGSILKAA